MKTIRVATADGDALDWLVAKCRGEPLEFGLTDDERYSTNWALAGPIIEHERLCIDIGHDGVWLACHKQNYEDEPEEMQSGPTPLIAAMRCLVALKLGGKAEVPEELL